MESITSSKLFTTRQGTILLGVIAAVIAAIALIVYLDHYRSSVNAKTAPTPVLQAKSLIQEGTSGDVVGSSNLYRVTSIPKTQIKAGAFADPSELAGKVALTNIFPGQQLTAADFGASTNPVTGVLSKNQRAVVVPLGSPQQVGGQIGPASHVDVWITANGAVKELFQNMYVIGVGSDGNVTLRATPIQAGKLIYASQNTPLWLVLRPTVATTSPPVKITAANLGG